MKILDFTVAGLFCFVKGIGPSYADKYETDASKIENECTLDICTCIGPIGLDYRITRVTKDVQMRAFEEQVNISILL